MKKLIAAICAALALYAVAAPAVAQDSTILRSLPTAVQKEIESTRSECRGLEGVTYGTSGDEGLIQFTVSGVPAVFIDRLRLCGGQCLKGTNCATGYTHTVDIYVRSGNTWRKAFSRDVTEPVFVSTELTGWGEDPPKYGKFRALVIKLHAWENDKDCPAITRDPTEWKKRTCDFVVKWDEQSKKFTLKPL